MTEMDFDELDKAVNSLMGGVKKSATDKDEPTTLTISSTLAADEKPEYEKLEKVAQKIGSETIDISSLDDANVTVVEVPTSTPRTGRFMDVMHPSSDMKTATGVVKPSAAKEPEVTTPTVIVPQDPTDPVVAVEPPTPTEEPIAEPEPLVQTTDGAQASMQSVAVEEAPSAAADQDVEPVPVVEATPLVVEPAAEPQIHIAPSAVPETPVLDEPTIEPQTSPFIADAKVEKRPLGGAAGFTQVDDAPDADASQSSFNPDHIQLAPEAPEKVPDEYHGDLLAIETGASLSEAVASANDTTPATANTTPIYNVDTLHAPLNHPAKKSSGWLWIVLTILIVAICGGAAAAFYLLTM